jgi:hypothetical protein
MTEIFFGGARPLVDRRTGVHLVPGLNEVGEEDAKVLLSTRKDVLDLLEQTAQEDAGQED